jgi:hypothetical protein
LAFRRVSSSREFVSGIVHAGVETLESIANIEYQSR